MINSVRSVYLPFLSQVLCFSVRSKQFRLKFSFKSCYNERILVRALPRHLCSKARSRNKRHAIAQQRRFSQSIARSNCVSALGLADDGVARVIYKSSQFIFRHNSTKYTNHLLRHICTHTMYAILGLLNSI